MIDCPIQNSAVFGKQDWLQIRPALNEKNLFGDNANLYSVFKYPDGTPMKGHNGLDYKVPIGTPLFSPFSGFIKVKDSKKNGYGLHVRLRNPFDKFELVLGHLSKVEVKTGDRVHKGQLLGFSGNTGFSTGPHVHEGLRTLIFGGGDIFNWANVFNWEVENYDNGYFGYWNHLPYLLCWKGGFIHKTHKY